MDPANKDKIRALLKSIETGDPGPIAVVNEDKYIQHNPQTHEGSEGLATLFERLSKTAPRVNIVRAFEDGDFVFAHTEYDFSRRNIGFEVFRFEDDRAVEHWDNIQARSGPNPSGHSMVDGATEAVDHDRTENNRAVVRAFVEAVLIGGQVERLTEFVDAGSFIEHNPRLTDDLSALRAALKAWGPVDRLPTPSPRTGRGELRSMRQRGVFGRHPFGVLRSLSRRWGKDRRALGHDRKERSPPRVEKHERQVLRLAPSTAICAHPPGLSDIPCRFGASRFPMPPHAAAKSWGHALDTN